VAIGVTWLRPDTGTWNLGERDALRFVDVVRRSDTDDTLESLVAHERFAEAFRRGLSTLRLRLDTLGALHPSTLSSLRRLGAVAHLSEDQRLAGEIFDALLPALRAAPQPLVVNLTDIGGERAESHYAHYSVSKAGLIMLTRALAVELAPRVRVNAISPGTVVFPEDFDEAAQKATLARIPLGRVGSAEDVARVVVFLAREAPYISGQVIAVDGARSAQL